MKTWITTTLLLSSAALAAAQAAPETLSDARRGFETKLQRSDRHEQPLEPPPEELFSLVRYPGPKGELTAYVGQVQEKGRKSPAMIWITGGFPPGGIGSSAWEPAELDNEQSAQAYRHAGLVMMYPTLRGANGNAGVQEAFLGEVDDIVAAADYLKTLEHIDPARIYLGGHSTGGTLALLVAEVTDRFRAVVALGPVSDPAVYGQESLPYDLKDAREARVRAPIHFLGGVRSPTFVIEGEDGNSDSVRAMQAASKNPALRFIVVEGANHFDVIAPTNALIARRIAEAKGDAFELDPKEVQAACDAQRVASREADDLDTLADLRRNGTSLTAPQRACYYVVSRERAALTLVATDARAGGFQVSPIEARTNERGGRYYLLLLRKEVVLGQLSAVFETSAAVSRLATTHGVSYNGWDLE
jgi:dienelactone hydrolase